MYCNPYCPPVSPVTTAPTKIVKNIYHPQIVPVIHPIEIVNNHVCVPVPKHMYAYSVKDKVGGVSAGHHPCYSHGYRDKRR
ncbi:hypothetical protein PAE9249_04015 [Paenibacillus sp. CECT 9249]|nr:hypothetical protein PAE9249_04015 [Paenibacillus sp. CECT 9249]